MYILLHYRKCEIGGLQTWMLELSSRFRQLGHQCDLFFFSRGSFEPSIPSDQDVHFGDLSDLLRLVRTRRIDVVHGASADWDVGLSAVRRLGAKLILTGHGRIHPSWNSCNCDALVGCSEWDAKAQEICTDLAVQVIKNGIDTTRFCPPERMGSGPPIVAWVGRGSDLNQKRIDKLAAIGPELHRRGNRLWIADSDGPDKVIPSAAKVLQSIAEFWGKVEPERMPWFFREVSASGGCLLSTSSFEGLSCAQLEAQACGCPVIGPNLKGINEAVRPENGGILYPDPLEPSAIAQMICEVLSDWEGMNMRRVSCRRFVESNFNCRTMAEAYLQVYEEAPYARRKGWQGFINRHRLSPWVDFEQYKDYRWTAGHNQYLASVKLRMSSDIELATQTILESLKTSATLFVRRQRLFQLMKILKDYYF